MKKSILIIFITIALLIILYPISSKLTDKIKKPLADQIKNLNINKDTKLMIVAHPDDEILWGGAHLIEDNYVVVCITCGERADRLKEFKTVMGLTNDQYLYLGYPDKTNGERDNWESVYEKIKIDLQKIYELTNWDIIVTHNPEGEYGHQHHIMTNEIVNSIVDDKDKLYYFGKYYSRKKMETEQPELESISEENLFTKKEILSEYKTQKDTIAKFEQMLPYENFIKSNQWK